MLKINLDDNLKIRLQEQAENHGHTLEQEITDILYHHLTTNQVESLNLADRIKQRFAGLEDIEIPEIVRDKMRIPPNFD